MRAAARKLATIKHYFLARSSKSPVKRASNWVYFSVEASVEADPNPFVTVFSADRWEEIREFRIMVGDSWAWSINCRTKTAKEWRSRNSGGRVRSLSTSRLCKQYICELTNPLHVPAFLYSSFSFSRRSLCLRSFVSPRPRCFLRNRSPLESHETLLLAGNSIIPFHGLNSSI